jgi:hypothetical protein
MNMSVLSRRAVGFGFALSLAGSLKAYGQTQGAIYFSNYVPLAGINAPVFNGDGTQKLEGAGYLAQLYAGPSADSLMPVAPPD